MLYLRKEFGSLTNQKPVLWSLSNQRPVFEALANQRPSFTFRDPGTRSSWCSRRLFLTDIGLSYDVKCQTQAIHDILVGQATGSMNIFLYFKLDFRERNNVTSNKSQTPLSRCVICWYLLYKLIIKDIFFGDLSTTTKVQKLKSSYGKKLFCRNVLKKCTPMLKVMVFLYSTKVGTCELMFNKTNV